MKNSWEWDENDLLNLVQEGTKESNYLDFKDSRSLMNTDQKKNEISKDVSAFANAGGGILIYGMNENGHVATGLDSGSDPNIITKEWLDQVINSRIHRKIDGIKINQVDLHTKSPGNVAYVVYVPESIRAPHQAADKKFYRRYAFESEPMEEYEIRDVARRSEGPDLRINFHPFSQSINFTEGNDHSQSLKLLTTISNDSKQPAEYAVIRIYLDKRLTITSGAGMKLQQTVMFIKDKKIPITTLAMNWAIPAKIPIFEGPNFRLSDDKELEVAIPLDMKEKSLNFVMGYEIQSPRMSVKQEYKIAKLEQGIWTVPDTTLEWHEMYNDLTLPWEANS